MPKMIILDGNSLAYRAFYALPPLTTPDGLPTNVLHGFMTMLIRLQQEQTPDYWVVAFDKMKAEVRIEQYAEYKAHRPETPEGLRPQFTYLKEVLTAFAVPYIELARYEADDLIATVTRQAEQASCDVRIYTGDRDAFQLISPLTRVCLTKKGVSEIECYDEQALWERYQLKPHQIIDLKGLMGDASDNIPGVPGVGEKTALKLLWAYGSLEEVLAHRQEVAGKKLQQTLLEYDEQARLSKQLATMISDAPIEIQLDQFTYREPAEESVRDMLNKYHLRSIQRVWLNRRVAHPGMSVGQESVASLALGACEQPDHDAWLRLFAHWREQHQSLVLAWRRDASGEWHWGIAVEGKSYTFDRTVDADVRIAWLDLLADNGVPKIMADEKALVTQLRRAGADLRGVELDLALAAYLIQPAQKNFAPLDLARVYYPHQEDVSDVAQEAAVLAQIVSRVRQDLAAYELTKLLTDIEQPLSRILSDMEFNGIGVNTEILQRFKSELRESILTLEKDIYALAGSEFNINSPQQLGAVLYEHLGLPATKKTKTGYSTDAETLEDLRSAHPIIEKILDYRQLSKLMSTYVIGLLAQEQDGRIHTTFQQTITATGRLSSVEPNLQNIPIRLAYGRQLRKVFHPTEPGWLLLSADYSQIELRVLAHYAQDELLSESFRLDQDVHARTASEVFGIPLVSVTPEMRRRAKAVNFGLIYGLTDFGLARDLGIPRKEAKYYIEQYFARYRGIKRYLEDAVARAKQDGYVRTLLNRRRNIPELFAANHAQRQFGERIAMNTPIQGSAADIIKIAMIDVAQGIESATATLLLQVHDELVLQVAAREVERIAGLLKEKMENALALSVPLKVDCKAGDNWYDMKPILTK
ncbi:MAG: DNA polymerase I [Peptococcaceae bacterium]|jgi:DNA polymerase-1|nr:DNA polymerase I [Peptococcaceae bacterium]